MVQATFSVHKNAGNFIIFQEKYKNVRKTVGPIKGTRHKQNSLSGNTLFNYMPTYTRTQKKS